MVCLEEVLGVNGRWCDIIRTVDCADRTNKQLIGTVNQEFLAQPKVAERTASISLTWEHDVLCFGRKGPLLMTRVPRVLSPATE